MNRYVLNFKIINQKYPKHLTATLQDISRFFLLIYPKKNKEKIYLFIQKKKKQ